MNDGIAIKAMVSELAPVVREYVEAAQGPLIERVGALETEKAALVARCEALEARPAPEKGEKGEDGVSPAPEAIAEAFAPLAEQIIVEVVAKAVAELPPAERGPAGEKGERGEAGHDGRDGTDGADGRGVKELLIDRDGNLVATMDDGEMKALGPVVGKDGTNGVDGAPGNDGRDGFSLNDFDVERGSDGRSYILKFEGEGTRHEYELTFPVPVYCGVFKEGEDYVPGDLVTWGGSLWHCDLETKDKPGTESWTLAVKKGRDGKDAKVG